MPTDQNAVIDDLAQPCIAKLAANERRYPVEVGSLQQPAGRVKMRPPAGRILRPLATGLLAIAAAACGSDSTGPGGNGSAELSGMLVFVADSFGHSAVEAIETDGTGRRELVARSEGRIGTVLIGPDGDRLVFMRDSVPYRYDLPDGPLRHLEVEADATPEDWTPGDRIVWSLPDAGIGEGVRSFELFTTATDGTDPRIFELEVSRTETHALHFRRQFQDRVAFAATSAGVGREIYTIGVDGTGIQQVTEDEFAKGSPDPSPDGGRIAYRVVRDNLVLTIDMVDLTSGETSSLIGPEAFEPYQGGQVVQTAWSPQGDRVAVEVEHGATGIWIAPADGSAPDYLFRGDPTFGNLVWSRDGQWLLVRSPISGEISRLDPETGEFTDLTTSNEPGFSLRPVGLIP